MGIQDRRDESGTTPGGRTLVLGGCGFLGSHICRELIRTGHYVRVFDKQHADRRRIKDIAEKIDLVEGDIARTSDVTEVLQDIETVFHLVHTTVPGSSMVDPSYDVTSNVAATVAWLSKLNQTSIRRMIFVSSGGTVYGIPREPVINERHPTNRISSYGITKLAIEKYVSLYAELAGIDYRSLRPSNVIRRRSTVAKRARSNWRTRGSRASRTTAGNMGNR